MQSMLDQRCNPKLSIFYRASATNSEYTTNIESPLAAQNLQNKVSFDEMHQYQNRSSQLLPNLKLQVNWEFRVFESSRLRWHRCQQSVSMCL